MPIRMQKPMVRSANLSIARTSPKHTDPFYGSPEYAQWAEDVKKRDGYKCVDPDCPGPHWPGQKVYADHIKRWQDGGAKYDIKNGITRCASSHTRKTNRDRAAYQRGEQTRDRRGPAGEGESNP